MHMRIKLPLVFVGFFLVSNLLSASSYGDSKFLTYCLGDRSEAEKKTIKELLGKIGQPKEINEATCTKLQEAFMGTQSVVFGTASVILSSPLGISDITVVSFFPHLTSVAFTGNPVKDLSPLKGLTNLEFLDAMNSEVDDVTPLAGLTHLRRLGLSGTKVTKIGALGATVLKELTQLHVHQLQLTDWDELKVATKLMVLEAKKSNIATLEVIAGATSLETLKLNGAKQLTSVKGLAGLTALQYLEITEAPVQVLNLGDLTELKELVAENMPLTEPPNLAPLGKLEKVSLDSTKLAKLPEMAATVTVVSVWDNPLSDITALKKLPKLETAPSKAPRSLIFHRWPDCLTWMKSISGTRR